MTLTNEVIDNIWRATEGHWNFARVIEARVHEELRKQVVDFSFEFPALSLQREALRRLVTVLGIVAPIPPTPTPTPATKGGITACPHGVPHCWPCEICDVPTPNLMLLKDKR